MFLLPAVILVRLIRPIVHVRFGCLNSNALGDFCSLVWDYKAKEKLNLHPKRRLDLFWNGMNNHVSNTFADELLTKNLPIIRSKYFYYFWRANLWLPDYKKYDCSQVSYIDWPARNLPHLFSLKSEDLKEFEETFRSKSGIKSDFICFHSRDNAYKSTIETESENYSHQSYRNSSFDN
ncbi:hypothetical protein N8829_00960, partial [bacterium]|nr:hypothetical protein [bacterium]